MIYDANQGKKPENEGWLPPAGPVTFGWSDDGKELLLYPPGASKPYPIDLAGIETPLHLVGWLDHLLGKIWFDRRGARELIRLICEGHKWEYHDA